MKNFILLTMLVSMNATAALRVHIKRGPLESKVLSISESNLSTHLNVQNKKAKLLRSLPYFIEERAPLSRFTYEEWLVEEASLQTFYKSMKVQSTFSLPDPNGIDVQNTEVRTLVHQGPKENRINLTILGDGYTLSQKEKFFADAERTVQGLFEGQTFSSYLPLFNIYAVFVPSNQSGIGDGQSIDTAFRLYRNPKGSKRAIYPGNESALESALKLAPATDYPIVLANDEFYGGLGGRYAISTSSVLSGLVVLRHELGHNFGEVGEEYDHGMVYMGANSSASSKVKWSHWANEKVSVHEAKIVSGEYVWKNLKDGKYESKFRADYFPNGYFFGIISSVGWETAQDVLAKIDNTVLDLKGTFNSDRNFYTIEPVKGFVNSQHSFSVEEKIKDENNVLGFAELYVAPQDYDFTINKIGAFATYNEYGSKTYRPTHNSCLMRDMSVTNFCSVDKENIWHKFLSRVSLIDSVDIKIEGKQKTIKLSTLPLAGLQIKWFKKVSGTYVIIPELENKTEWSIEGSGTYRVMVSFRTPEVLKYSSNFDAMKDISM